MPYLTPSINSRLAVWLLLAAALALPTRGAERNLWPVLVGEVDPVTGELNPAHSIAPLFSGRTDRDGRLTQVFRPFVLHTEKGPEQTTRLLYPLFMWRRDAYGRTDFSFFQIVNDQRQPGVAGRTATHGFDLWPFWFSRETGDPATTYHAIFPVAGSITRRFGYDRLTWAAFPLLLQSEKRGRRIVSAPWPFVRVISGAGHHGFELWPLMGERGRAGDYQERFLLWPLYSHQVSHLSAPEPDEKLNVLPFYSAAHGPGYRETSYLWPLFGTTHRTLPSRYDETRYLWPFLVQGRGEDRNVNRWGPFYTHSVIKGYDKTWLLWPLLRHAEWMEGGLAQRQDRLLFFVYWSLEQRDPRRPGAAPASKRHLWPLFSAWDNGAGRRQIQFLSPFEVVLPNNDPVRQLYTPLFAVARWEQSAPGHTRGSILWGLVSWRQAPGTGEFHLGPLFSREHDTARAEVSIGSGLLGWRREAGSGRWKFFLFDFSRHTPTLPPSGNVP